MKLTPEQLDRLAASLRAGEYNLLLGAAASLGSTNADGKTLPLADAYRVELCKLKGAKEGHSLQRIYQTLTADEVDQHVTARFSGCTPGPALRALPLFLWKRIFTLNIDDALEAAYANADRYQIPKIYNYRDTYEENGDRSNVQIVHLHGHTQRPQDGYIFSRDAYFNIIKTSNPWMVNLSHFLSSEPFIIMGSSLDETDLDYFLSLRSQSTSRLDRGPSILIEPFGDIVTDTECERLDLLRYSGTSEDFIEFISSSVINRPRPQDLVTEDEKSIFIEEPTAHDISSFYSDFEKVPAATEANANDPRFFFGHVPSWSDLTLQYDISRPVNSTLVRAVEDAFSGRSDSRLIFLSDHVGVGKSTALRRVGFDFARQGTTVLSCSALSRLEPRLTASMLNNIAGRCLVIVDDFADQVYSIEAVLSLAEKKDLVFLAAERSYRRKFVTEVLTGKDYSVKQSEKLSDREMRQLIQTYVQAGLVGDSTFIDDEASSVAALKDDPIAIACCRIMNDLRPLDRIVESLFQFGNKVDRVRYLTAALAQYCTKSGVKFDLLIASSSGAGINQQFNNAHPFPLTHAEDKARNYVIPLNGTLATRMLEVASQENQDEMLNVFINLGKAVAPRVNRRTIVQRTPEARLAARLFDLDQVVEKFLNEKSIDFYESVEEEWRWNSRYWEQVALLNLYKYQSTEEISEESLGYLNLAVGHARHAVSIEYHPLTLTTLAKILFYQAISMDGDQSIVSEAIASIREAISMEAQRNRSSVHPYAVLFQGIRSLPSNATLKDSDASMVKTHLAEATRKFPRDNDIIALAAEVTGWLR
ncbi:SIR2 family protein [Sphingopyxis sp. JAI108]|uniref:P-loop NTPase n=1 Tax=Sphingopyxis sp. JAI108 TaxID=2723060 RepID=UPI0015CB9FC4|nr:SIR2 family protein [Sphingopyxis sp. JAI108]NYF31935.1 hypothetical protein [Sphingopyxis sp. JAI108]